MSGRRVVVTGASSGIGRATATLLASRGWDVIGVARRKDRLDSLAADTGIRVVQADLTDTAQIERMRAEVAEAGPLHALVNNAGGAFGFATLEESADEDWQRMWDANVMSTKRVTTALLPSLRAGSADDYHADILTVTSIAGHVPYEGGSGYNAVKFAQRALVGVLRLELAGEPIRVVEIAPGLVQTEEFALVRFGGDRSRAEAVYDGVEAPLTADDIARVMVDTLELPGHINLDLITVKPVAQAAPHKLIRGALTPKV